MLGWLGHIRARWKYEAVTLSSRLQRAHPQEWEVPEYRLHVAERVAQVVWMDPDAAGR